MTMMRWRSLCIATVLLSAAAGCQREEPAAARQAAARPAGLSVRPDFGGDFSLTNHDGQAFRLADVRGKAVLLFFGYTSCPDMCPMTMSRIASALDRVGDQRSEVVTLFVSVDPTRDTPAVLKDYVATFSTPLVGLTGTPAEIAKVTAAYRASSERINQTDSPHYLMNHTTAIFLIDRQGQLREYFKDDESPTRVGAALRAVLEDARAAEPPGVRAVQATIDGLTCPTCVPPLTAAFRRHFEHAEAIEVDDARDTATVRPAADRAFSAEAFHRAVADAKMRVVEVRIEVCGRVVAQAPQRWLVAGASRFLIRGTRALPMHEPVCLEGWLDASQDPAALDLTAVAGQASPSGSVHDHGGPMPRRD